MPLVRIDIADHHSQTMVANISTAIHEAFLEVFGIPLRDKFHIINKHPISEIIAEDAGLGFERCKRGDDSNHHSKGSNQRHQTQVVLKNFRKTRCSGCYF